MNQNVLDDQWLEFWIYECKTMQPDFCLVDTSLNSKDTYDKWAKVCFETSIVQQNLVDGYLPNLYDPRNLDKFCELNLHGENYGLYAKWIITCA